MSADSALAPQPAQITRCYMQCHFPVGSRTGAPTVGSGGSSSHFRAGPQSGSPGLVSSPRLFKRSMRISRTTLYLSASREGLWARSGRERFPSSRRPSDPVVSTVQSQPLVLPLRTPPLPTKSTALASPHQVSPYLLLYPVANVAKTPTRMSYREVVHPPTQDRVDERHHPSHRL